MSQSNESANGIRLLQDLIVDEYGNYYEVVAEKTNQNNLIEVTLAHAYYEISFSKLITNDLLKEYDHKHIGVKIQDVLNGHLKSLKAKGRKIFTIQDLIDNNTKVKIMDILERHPRSK